MTDVPLKLWTDDTGQNIAEYAAMLAGFNFAMRAATPGGMAPTDYVRRV